VRTRYPKKCGGKLSPILFPKKGTSPKKIPGNLDSGESPKVKSQTQDVSQRIIPGELEESYENSSKIGS